MRNARKEIRRGSRGQATIEFMLGAIFLMVLVFSAVELSVMLYEYVSVAGAAKEGVRYAVVHGANMDPAYRSGPTGTGTTQDCATNITAVVSAVTNYANYPGMTVSVCYLDGNNSPPNRVQVTVSYPYINLFALGWTSPTIHASAEGRITY